MSNPTFSESFNPAPLSTQQPNKGTARDAKLDAARTLAVRADARLVVGIMLAANAVFLLRAGVPEVAGWLVLRPYFNQVAPLIATPWTTGGLRVSPDQVHGAATWQCLALASSVVLYIATTKGAFLRYGIVPVAFMSALSGVMIVLPDIAAGGMAEFTDVGVGWAAAVITAGLSIRVGLGALRGGVATVGATRAPFQGLLPLYLVFFPFSLAVGRLVYAPELVDVLRLPRGRGPDMELAAFAWQDTPSLVLLTTAGAALGVIVWVAIRLLPHRGTSLTRLIVTGIVALLVAVAGGSQAADAAQQLISSFARAD